MRALLDTHVFLWWITDDSRLSGRARESSSPTERTSYCSVRRARGRSPSRLILESLAVPENLESFLADQLQREAIEVLPVYLSYALHVYRLPDHHRDPFDRILVAQCAMEGLPLVSADEAFERYPVEVIW